MVALGTHTLVKRLAANDQSDAVSSDRIRNAMIKRHAWFEALCSKRAGSRRHLLINPGVNVDGVQLRVAAIKGKPGDVFIMHPWLFHAPSRNCTTTPRVMVSESVFNFDN